MALSLPGAKSRVPREAIPEARRLLRSAGNGILWQLVIQGFSFFCINSSSGFRRDIDIVLFIKIGIDSYFGCISSENAVK